MKFDNIRRMLGISIKEFADHEEEEEYYVRGSGLVHIPRGQLNQIPLVIREHHIREAELEKLRAGSRYGSWVR